LNRTIENVAQEETRLTANTDGSPLYTIERKRPYVFRLSISRYTR